MQTRIAPHAHLAELRKTHFRTERDAQFERRLARLLQHDADATPTHRPVVFARGGETRGILVTGAPGSGKTVLVDRALVKHPALQAASIHDETDTPGEGGSDGPLRVVSITVPSPASMKSLALEILRRTGYPIARAPRDVWALWNTVRFRFAVRGTTVLWLDEAHDLFGAGTATAQMLAVLKSLMQGEGAVILVLSGIDRLGAIAAVDPQLDRRLSKLVLPPVAEPLHGKMLRRMLAHYCAALDIAPPEEADLVGRLIHGARGQLGRAIELMQEALEEALAGGHGALDLQHFAEAVAMKEGCLPADNVFLAPNWAQIQYAPTAAQPPARRSKTRRR